MSKTKSKHRGTTTLEYRGESYEVVPEMALLSELESTLGGAPKILGAFAAGEWSIGGVVQFVHICLKHVDGPRPKHQEVYEAVLDDGAPKYVEFAVTMLSRALAGNQDSEPGEAAARD